MKEKNLFDILENAENDSMDRLIDKCPEISDEQLDRILEMSERKYTMKKGEKMNTESNIEMTGNNVVAGVERVSRPSWIRPLSMAASVVLVAGIIVGSTALIKKNSKKPEDNMIVTPGATVTSAITKATETTEITTEASTTEMTTFNSFDDTDLKPFAGKWKFIASETNNVDVDGKTIGYIEINENGTYKLFGTDGSVETGTVSRSFEEIAGTKITKLDFTGGMPLETGSYYYDETLDVLHFGNGDAARLIRVTEDTTVEKVDVKKLAGSWSYMELDQAYLPDYKVASVGSLNISEDGTYTYTDNAGKTTSGTVETGVETIEGTTAQTVRFLENGEFKFGGYYNWGQDTISIGNGGLAYLCRTDSDVSIDEITGKWNYQEADAGTTVDEWSYLKGTMEVMNDSTYTFTDLDGNTTKGKIEIVYENNEEMFNFYEGLDSDAMLRFTATYKRNKPNVLSLGNSGHSCFRRPAVCDIDVSKLAGKWDHQKSDSAFSDESDIFNMGVMIIDENGDYTYTDSFGKIASTGTISTRCEEYANGSTINMIDFVSGSTVHFTAYYNDNEPDSLYLGNGGISRFHRADQ